MNAIEMYVAGTVTLLFVVGIGWMVAALRKSAPRPETVAAAGLTSPRDRRHASTHSALCGW